MEGRLLLNVVVGEGATVLQDSSPEEQDLLVGLDTLPVWIFCFTLSMVSFPSTSRVIVMLVGIATKIVIANAAAGSASSTMTAMLVRAPRRRMHRLSARDLETDSPGGRGVRSCAGEAGRAGYAPRTVASSVRADRTTSESTVTAM